MRMSWRDVTWASVAWAAATGATAQVPRTDKVECALPGGHRVELASRYSWQPVTLHPRSSRSHFDQQPYNATLKPERGRPLALKSAPDGTPLNDGVAVRLCGQFGAISELVFSDKDLVDVATRVVLDTAALEDIGISGTRSLRSVRHQAILDERGLSFPVGWAFGRVGDRIVGEQGLVQRGEDGQVRAVIRFEWVEGDKTWREVGVFDTSELFVIGLAWESQPFTGKPIRVNGKKPG